MSLAAVDGWLVPLHDRELTPHRYLAGDKRIRPVECVVLHWTASPRGSENPHGADEPRIRRWLSGVNARVSSTHFVVLRDGTVLQGATIHDRTWHAKECVWSRPDGTAVTNLNVRSIGVDLENVGPLTRRGRERWIDAYGGAYRGPPPACDANECFEPFVEVQLRAFLLLAKALAAAVPLLADPRRWPGHCDVRRSKMDPGPTFPRDRLVAALGGARP